MSINIQPVVELADKAMAEGLLDGLCTLSPFETIDGKRCGCFFGAALAGAGVTAKEWWETNHFLGTEVERRFGIPYGPSYSLAAAFDFGVADNNNADVRAAQEAILAFKERWAHKLVLRTNNSEGENAAR